MLFHQTLSRGKDLPRKSEAPAKPIPRKAALTVQAWQYANWTGLLVPVRGGQSAFVGYAGGGDWWVHPEVLAQIQDLQGEGLAVIRITQVSEPFP